MSGSSSAEKEKKKHHSTPKWLTMMFSASFFETCASHRTKRKNELHYFCLDCLKPECLYCLREHNHKHKYIQIRKYVHRNVVNLDDIQRYFDCSGIQTYIINSAKVVHLTQRPSPRKIQPNDSNGVCLNCSRSLHDTCNYCCIACKAMLLEDGGFPSTISSSSNAPANDLKIKDVDDQSSESCSKINLSLKKRERKQKHPTRSPFF